MNRREFTKAALLGAVAAGLPIASFAQGSRTIAVMFDSLQSPFWISSFDAFKAEIAERGWTMLENISNLDDSRQFQQVQSMIERGVDGIVIVQTDANAVIPAIRAANAAGIPMVHYNRPPAESDAKSVAVQADNRTIMRDTVTALVEEAKKQGGKYKAALLIGDLGDQNAIARRDGFFDVVDQNTDTVEVVARIATEWNADVAFAGLTNALQANPDINFLVTSSDFLHPQIEQALKVAGKWHKRGEEGHVLFAGFDGDEGGYARLADGYLDAVGVQNVFFEVDLTLNALQDMWDGKEVDDLLLDPGFVITPYNFEEKRDEMWGYLVWKSQNG
ncbi:monosaccharide ABC transporter substrate-binding protein (CUT2 family) [Aliiruegeria haliotis]|uniref:Monosaccharide ABC transporter substrate-binding protein (CUT2 family) n=1 Tax=Aliiruegeria haliotis TaxID=1280846 RepID=A0A2T0RLP4_9RHOB|nr:sugar ABC transporter substrate-binding protein [Aliiruegeria haliotis]PRY22115.1 monosaccharide ABC transporter substrate-binding protein (CUT2 family) [Aliiruegeria haliotis]